MQEEKLDKLKWDEIGIESLQLALDQGEKMLKATIDAADYQANRVSTILKSVIVLLIIFIGYLVSSKPVFELVYLETTISVVVLLTVLPLLLSAYRAYDIDPLGNNPSHILNETNIKYGGENLEKYLLFNCCRTIEDSIDINKHRNDSRIALILMFEKRIKTGIIIIIIFPLFWFLIPILNEFVLMVLDF